MACFSFIEIHNDFAVAILDVTTPPSLMKGLRRRRGRIKSEDKCHRAFLFLRFSGFGFTCALACAALIPYLSGGHFSRRDHLPSPSWPNRRSSIATAID
jgi:hypothetical protein